MGPDALLCVEQKVILESDPERARELARTSAAIYLTLPNYRNNWLQLGFEPEDIDAGGSDRFIDRMFAWGNAESLKRRVQNHLDAGADHVCIQPVNPNGGMGDPDWAALEALAPG